MEGSIVNVDIISLEGNSVADPGGGGPISSLLPKELVGVFQVCQYFVIL